MSRSKNTKTPEYIAAIDVGTNAVRLELARLLRDGAVESIHSERDPVRPGEGSFLSGIMPKPVVDRLTTTMRRYSALCRRYRARVRAVATSAFRDARNRKEVIARIERETGIKLEVISGKEEARLIALGVFEGQPEHRQSMCVDIGGGSTEIAVAQGETPNQLWSLNIGAVRITEQFKLKGAVSDSQLDLVRQFVQESVSEGTRKKPNGLPKNALGSSGTVGAIIQFSRNQETGHVTLSDITRAVEKLAGMGTARLHKRFDARRADIIVAGAVILEAVMREFKVSTMAPIDRGLRHGVLRDMSTKIRSQTHDTSLFDEAVKYGRELHFEEEHARHVSKLAIQLFDDLAPMHKLHAAARQWLEIAAVLHDIGRVVNEKSHHKHSAYLVLNSDFPGLSETERALVAHIARFHRRSAPAVSHEDFEGLTPSDVRMVRKCAMILRIADSLDRSHHQPIQKLKAHVSGNSVVLTLNKRAPIDLEAWDVSNELSLFREIFGHRLILR